MNSCEVANTFLQCSEKKNRRIKEAYLIYREKQDPFSLNDLIERLFESFSPMVCRLLRNKGCYSEDNRDEVLNEAGTVIGRLVKTEKPEKYSEDTFPAYARGIFENKAKDLIRNHYKDPHYDDLSMDEPIGDGTTTRGELIPDDSNTIMGEAGERKAAYKGVLFLYCMALTISEAAPPANLALFYARIYPHFLSAFYGKDTIPDSKRASAKWACQKMADLQVGILSQMAEQAFQKKIDQTLSWGESHLQKLREPDPDKAPARPVAELIYTDVYSQHEVDRWSDHLHRALAVKTLQLIAERPAVASLAREYIGNSIDKFKLEGER